MSVAESVNAFAGAERPGSSSSLRVRARGLVRRYGRFTAVDGIDLDVPDGRVLGVLGPNGAGKTTTIRMIAGFLPPTEGTLEVDGVDVRRRPLEARRRIGYLPESTPLHPEMRTRDYLRFRASLQGLGGARRREAVERAIERCDLAPVALRRVGRLSKGYRQRTGLAAAIVHEPPVLILDEPTVGLDPRQVAAFRALVRSLASGRAVLLSTHVLPEAERTCDEVVFIDRGRIRARGTIDAMRDRAAERLGWRVEVAAAADGPRIVAVLEALDGVAAASAAPDDPAVLRVRPAPDAPPPARFGPALAAAVVGAGAGLRELRPDAAGLDELFRDAVEDAGDGPATGGGA